MNYHFKISMAPGDTIGATSFIRDLHNQFPACIISIEATAYSDVFKNYNFLSNNKQQNIIDLNYRTEIKQLDIYPQHFLSVFYSAFHRQTGLQIELTDPRPQLILSQDELTPITNKPYWVVCAGGKPDTLTKIWSKERFQKVIDSTSKFGISWVQVGQLKDSRFVHIQHRLNNVTDLLGKTSIRELFSIIYNSSGVLCSSSMPMLIAAAFWRPCVVIAGGREPPYWTEFSKTNPTLKKYADKIITPHRFFHTIGKLDCCLEKGCWASSVVAPHNDSSFPNGFLCKRPGIEPDGSNLPACLQSITPEEVIDAVLNY